MTSDLIQQFCMLRRQFLKILAILGSGRFSEFRPEKLFNLRGERKLMNWVWFNLNDKKTLKEWEDIFQKWKKHGITGILPNVYDSRMALYRSKYLSEKKPLAEKILPLAREFDFEIHGWMWTMPNNSEKFVENFPEAFVVNRLGESARENPAYVKYYKFLCPNRQETKEHIRKIVTEVAQNELLDGIHLDYIRYPDVILPVALQPKYNIVQDKEYPQFDYCYCETCRRKFNEKTGIDPLEIENPAEHAEWNQFRYDSITAIVNEIVVPIVKKYGKKSSAAVFPNWKDVRQEWRKWNLAYFFPMLYHKFYNGDIHWLSERVREETSSLKPEQKLFAGLFAKSFNNTELKAAVKTVLENGASGVSLFTGFSFSDEQWDDFSKIIEGMNG